MEFLSAAVAWFLANIQSIVTVIGAFAIIATQTPNKTDDKILQVLLDVVNFLGGNLGKARNIE